MIMAGGASEDLSVLTAARSDPAIPSVDEGSIRAVFGFTDKYILYGSEDDITPLEPGRGFWINLSDEADLRVEIK